MDTLVSRPAFARALLDQIAAEKIPRQDLTAFHARQIRGLGGQRLMLVAEHRYGRSLNELTAGEASSLIDLLKEVRHRGRDFAGSQHADPDCGELDILGQSL